MKTAITDKGTGKVNTKFTYSRRDGRANGLLCCIRERYYNIPTMNPTFI